MVYRGKVTKGVVVLPDGCRIPDGTEVVIESVLPPAGTNGPQADFVQEALEIARSMEGLPPDLARNHDHYRFGSPKR